jgi:hypothetical protein
MTDIHLAIPPNIARKTAADIREFFPDITIRQQQTHPEMQAFFKEDFGTEEKTAHLTLTAYPSALAGLDESGRGIFAEMPRELPPMRAELARNGFLEKNPYYRVVAVITLVIVANRETRPFPGAWADLCREDLCDQVVIPPEETPAPALYSYYMEKFQGQRGAEAASRVQKTMLPQDINTAVDSGQYRAGMVFPAFARSFREGGACMVWPEEGALTLPLLAFLRKDAPKDVRRILAFVFGRQYQEFLARGGLFCSVREDVALFEEMMENNCRINWMGWPDYCALAGREMET